MRIRLSCMPPKRSIQDKFWKKVHKTDSCWFWTGYVGSHGYGQISMQGHIETSHRLSWMETNGVIPKKLFVLHRCDNRLCVNPKHLYLGTPHDNVRDMINRNRMPRREQRPNSKLTEEIVSIMRKEWDARKVNYGSCAKLGKRFGVSASLVCEVVHYKRWA